MPPHMLIDAAPVAGCNLDTVVPPGNSQLSLFLICKLPSPMVQPAGDAIPITKEGQEEAEDVCGSASWQIKDGIHNDNEGSAAEDVRWSASSRIKDDVDNDEGSEEDVWLHDKSKTTLAMTKKGQRQRGYMRVRFMVNGIPHVPACKVPSLVNCYICLKRCWYARDKAESVSNTSLDQIMVLLALVSWRHSFVDTR